MSRSGEFHGAARREVTWDHVRQANVGPHGAWNGADDGEVEEAVEKHLGHHAHESTVQWTHERVPVAALSRWHVESYARPCSCGNEEDCPRCYSKAAARSGPPIPVVQDERGEMHAPDGRHRLAGAVALGHEHIDAFVARARAK